jgi:hypothetical protein
MFCSYIWLRFIRVRLPKDIPFNLSLLGFIILVYICCIYLYIVYSLLIEKKPNNVLISTLVDYIFKPLKTLDQFIKNLPYINHYYKCFIVSLANKLDLILMDSKVYYYVFAIFPRLVLVTALWIDTFYFHKLHYIYKVLLIGILLVLNRYIIYSLKYAKEHFITQLEPFVHTTIVPYNREISVRVHYNGDEEAADDEYDPSTDTTMSLNFREFIEYATERLYYYNEKMSYTALNRDEYKKIYCKKHNIPFPYNANRVVSRSVWTQIDAEVDQKIDNIIKISVLIRYYQLYNYYTPEIKRMKVLIFGNYLICWLYILIMSFPRLPSGTFQFLWEIVEKVEPFSINIIEDYPMIMNVYVRSGIMILMVIGATISIYYIIKRIISKVKEKYKEYREKKEE